VNLVTRPLRHGAARIPMRGRAALVAAAWLGVMAVALAQGSLLDLLRGRPAGLTRHLMINGPFVLLWALATPLVWRAVRRWPVEGEARLRNALRLACLGLGFMVLSNGLYRLPLMADPAEFGRSLALGLVFFGPVAGLAWVVLVAIGHLARPRTPAARDSRLRLRNGGSTLSLAPEEILWVEARDNYVRLHTRSGMHLARHGIAELERLLDPGHFVRVHRSALVALAAVREVRPLSHGDGCAVLCDGTRVRVSRSRRDRLQRMVPGPDEPQ
jgi:hypothetical protein